MKHNEPTKNRKVAWSKLGCIAYITNGGQGVNIRTLLSRTEDGKWGLSGDYPLSHFSSVPGQQNLVHLSWNQTGSDLAVVDVFGRVSIFSILITMNRFAISRSCVMDQEDDMGAIVGLSWLNLDRSVASLRRGIIFRTDRSFIEPLVSGCGKA